MRSAQRISSLVLVSILVGSTLAAVGAHPLPDAVPEQVLPACVDKPFSVCDGINTTLQQADTTIDGLPSPDPVGAACSVSKAPCATVNETLAHPDPVGLACSGASNTCATANQTTSDPEGASCGATHAPCETVNATRDAPADSACGSAPAGACDMVNGTLAEPVGTACTAGPVTCDDANATIASGLDHANATCANGHQNMCAAANQTIANATAGHAGPNEAMNVIGGACADTQPTCENANETAQHPTAPVEAQRDAACANGHQNLCAGVNATIASPGPGAIMILVTSACADQPVTCEQLNGTVAFASDPVNATCDMHRTVCAAANESIVDLQDVDVDAQDPDHTVNDVRDPVDDLIRGACADGNDATCDDANGVVLGVITALPNAPQQTKALQIEAPLPGEYHNETVHVTINTSLPATDAGPVFWLEYAAAGTGDWRSGPGTLCPGNEQRFCTFDWKNLFAGDYTIRIAYGTRQTCRVNECATLGGNLRLDHTAPVSAVTTPSGLVTAALSFPINFTATDNNDSSPTVKLFVKKDDGAFVDSGLVPDSATGFLYTADTPATYAFYTAARDINGNVEAAPASADATLVVATDLAITAQRYFVNGDALAMDACVAKSGADLTTGTVTVDFAGQPGVALSHTTGCHWTSPSFGTVAVNGVTTENAIFHADSGIASGSATIPITQSPSRLVTVTLSGATLGLTGQNVTFHAHAVFTDTGTAVDAAQVQVQQDNVTTMTLPTNDAGDLPFNVAYESDGSHWISVSVASTGAVPTSATSNVAAIDATWTQIHIAYSFSQDPSNDADVGSVFNVTHCVTFASGAPVDGAEITLVHGNEIFPSSTSSTGCGKTELLNATVGAHHFVAVAGYRTQGTTFNATMASDLVVNFTRIELTIATNDSFVALGDTPVFNVTGVFAHDPSTPAAGARVQLRTGAGQLLETGDLDATGFVSIPHTFTGLFNASMSAALVSTPEHVTKFTEPSPNVTSMIATRVVVGPITTPQTWVNVSDTVAYRVPLTWEHDGSAIPSAIVNLSFGAAQASTCSASAGNATCSVQETGLFADAFNVTVDTPQGVSLVKDAPAQTPRTVWTKVGVVVSLADSVLPVNANASVIYSAVYLHDMSTVADFSVRANDSCGYSRTIVALHDTGIVTATPGSTTACESRVYVTLVSTSKNITAQNVTLPSTDVPVAWTTIQLSATADDSFASIGDAINVTGTATYASITTPFTFGNVTVTGPKGQTFGSGTIVDGHLTATLTNASSFTGAATFTIVNDAQNVLSQAPFTLPLTWSQVLLSASVGSSFNNESDSVTISGTAAYEGVGAVPSGAVKIVDDDGNTVTTATIASGAWSASVTEPATYFHSMNVSVVADDEHVVGVRTATPRLTFTHIDLVATAPADLFVNATSTLTFHVTATYAHGPAVTNATITAFRTDNSTTLGSCEIAAGACDLVLSTGGAVYDNTTVLRVTRAASNVTHQAPDPVYTPRLTWTRLVVTTSHLAGPLSTGEGAKFTATVTYAHNGALVPGAIVRIGNLTGGAQQNATDANGVTHVEAIETAAGVRNLTVTASDPSQAIGLADVDVPAPQIRWTAIGFAQSNLTYSPAPTGWTNGEPVWTTGTTVQVCGTAVSVDDGLAVANAHVLLRGVAKTANGAGVACVTIAPSGSPRTLSFTAHAVDGMVGGSLIDASQDFVTVLHYVSS